MWHLDGMVVKIAPLRRAALDLHWTRAWARNFLPACAIVLLNGVRRGPERLCVRTGRQYPGYAFNFGACYA